MLHLTTFGSVHLADHEGHPLDGPATQRRLLALLSILAAAGDGGISRDRIQFLLWADGDPEKTRHALTQTIYHARRSLACDDLFFAAPELRLNAARISSDVQTMEAALRTQDWSRAAELYRGPWLDGFYVAGAPEFEPWVESRRRSLAQRMDKAFDVLAGQCEATADWPGAVMWRRRQVELDAVNGRAALALIGALVKADDRPGALRHANLYEALLRADLDSSPDPAFQRAVAELRLGDPPLPAAADPPRLIDDRAQTEAPSASVPVTIPLRTPSQPRRPRRRALAAVIVTAVGMSALGTAVAAHMRAPVETQVSNGIVVAPFRVSGLDPSLSFLGNGVVELLTTRMGDDTSSRAADAGGILRAWSEGDVGHLSEPPRTRVLGVAQRLHATDVLVGSIVGDRRRLVISATLLAVPSGTLSATARVETSFDSLTVALDQIAAKLLMLKAGEADRLPLQPPPLRAIQAYLQARASYRQGRYGHALAEYELALKRDSSFVLAALQLALLADHLNTMQQHQRAVAIAWNNQRLLSRPDQSLLVAFAGPRFPMPSSGGERMTAWMAAVRASERADAWVHFGRYLRHSGQKSGSRALDERIAAATADVLPSSATRAAGTGGGYDGWRVALAREDDTLIAQNRALLPEADNRTLRAIAMASQFDAVGVDDGEEALRIRLSRARNVADRLDVLLGRHSLALNQGKAGSALEATRQLGALQPGSGAPYRLRVLDALYSAGDTTRAREAIDNLSWSVRAALSETVAKRVARPADLCVVGQWRLAHQQTEDIPRIIATLRAAASPRDAGLVQPNPYLCADLLASDLAVGEGSTDALARVAALDSLTRGGPAVGDAAAYINIAVARLYVRLSEPGRALEAIRRRPYMTGWPRYLATALRDEGGLAELTGDSAGARTAFTAFLALRRSPDPGLRDEVAEVRVILDRLAANPTPPR